MEFSPEGSLLQIPDVVEEGATGVEEEEIDAGTPITTPFNPAQIRITPRSMTIDLLLKRIAEDELNLEPAFQRRSGIWKPEVQSRLIESLLIRIPLPAFYLDAADEDRWEVIDGLQRLTALRRFVLNNELRLTGLEYLNDCEGASYDKLERRFQRRILESQVQVFLLEAGTPPEVKFNVFKRINTGGLPLSAQEIRHALNQGPAAELVRELADSQEFLTATGRAVNRERMADRECVLRFLAFSRTHYAQYTGKGLDEFLNTQMAGINNDPPDRVAALRQRFLRAMKTAHALFGSKGFCKRFPGDSRRYPVNKALFEALSVALGALNEQESCRICSCKDQLDQELRHLMGSSEFLGAISTGTGQATKVNRRFLELEALVRKALK